MLSLEIWYLWTCASPKAVEYFITTGVVQMADIYVSVNSWRNKTRGMCGDIGHKHFQYCITHRTNTDKYK